MLILKGMNFSLKEIKALLKSNESINTLNVLLSEKIIELEENIRNESDQLKQIQFIKKNISEESEYPVSNILNLKNKSKSIN